LVKPTTNRQEHAKLLRYRDQHVNAINNSTKLPTNALTATQVNSQEIATLTKMEFAKLTTRTVIIWAKSNLDKHHASNAKLVLLDKLSTDKTTDVTQQ
jgi:hypothetical protein